MLSMFWYLNRPFYNRLQHNLSSRWIKGRSLLRFIPIYPMFRNVKSRMPLSKKRSRYRNKFGRLRMF